MHVDAQRKVALAVVCVAILAALIPSWIKRPRDYTGALQHAVIWGTPREVEELLRKGANPNPVLGPGDEPLLQQALIHNMANGKGVAGLLLKHGADPNLTLSDGTSLMTQAVQFRRFSPDVVALFAEAGADFNRKGKNGDTVLHAAVCPPWQAPLDTIEALVKSGADPNIRRKDGSTALHGAVDRHGGDELDVVRLLLANGADPSIKDNEGFTPLARYWFSKEEVVLALVEAGSDLGVANQQGELPLMTALQRNQQRAILLMLAKGADPDSADKWGQTPLFAVAGKGDLALAKALVAKGANVNHASQSGATPLHNAAAQFQKEMVDYLISQGAKVDARDKKGLTPIDYAEGRNEPAEVQKRRRETVDSLTKAQSNQ